MWCTPGSAGILPAWTMAGLRRRVRSRASGPGGQDARAPGAFLHDRHRQRPGSRPGRDHRVLCHDRHVPVGQAHHHHPRRRHPRDAEREAGQRSGLRRGMAHRGAGRCGGPLQPAGGGGAAGLLDTQRRRHVPAAGSVHAGGIPLRRAPGVRRGAVGAAGAVCGRLGDGHAELRLHGGRGRGRRAARGGGGEQRHLPARRDDPSARGRGRRAVGVHEHAGEAGRCGEAGRRRGR